MNHDDDRSVALTASLDQARASVHEITNEIAGSMAQARSEGAGEHTLIAVASRTLYEEDEQWPRESLCVLAAMAISRLPEAAAERAHT